MASYSHGRGKQSYREFSRNLNEGVRDIKNAILQGEDYTANDVSRFLTRLTHEYIEYLKANGLDVELWGDRAIDASYKAGETLIKDFGLVESTIFNEEIPVSEVDEEIETDDNEESGTLLGYELLTKENKTEAKKTSKPRKRFFTKLDELQRYVDEVPYVDYLQIIHNSNGKVLGYRVWVEKAKDEKPKKNAS